MQTIAKIVSYIALAGIIVPPALYLAGSLPLPAVKVWMLVATVVWFVTVPFWMGRKQSSEE